jgi:hypothetical protein
MEDLNQRPCARQMLQSARKFSFSVDPPFNARYLHVSAFFAYSVAVKTVLSNPKPATIKGPLKMIAPRPALPDCAMPMFALRGRRT